MELARRALERLDCALGWLEWRFCALCLVSIVACTSLGVFFRYVLNDPLLWSNEVAVLSLLWLTFVGAAALYRDRGHVAVDAFSHLLPAPVRKAIGIVAVLLMGGSVAVAGWYMLTLIPLQHRKVISALGVPRSAYGVPVLWMAVSMTLASLRHLMAEVDGLRPVGEQRPERESPVEAD